MSVSPSMALYPPCRPDWFSILGAYRKIAERILDGTATHLSRLRDEEYVRGRLLLRPPRQWPL